jgi:uncharacterized protein (TIGR01777 family)
LRWKPGKIESKLSETLKKNILISGGGGFIGRYMTAELVSRGYKVYILSRNPGKVNMPFPSEDVSIIEWDYLFSADNFRDIGSVDAVINLAGEPIASHRWTKKIKERIYMSRIETTKAVVSAINNKVINPEVLINASATGYYGHREDEPATEETGAGSDFLARVCTEWEKEAYKVKNTFTRVVTLRTGIVLGEEGALKKMVVPFKYWAGGTFGKGGQWFSWIHIRDLANIAGFIIENQHINGPVNAVSPAPLKMKEFSKILGKRLNRPSWLILPGILLRIVLGERAGILLSGQKVIPEKILNAGFIYEFPEADSALKNLIS